MEKIYKVFATTILQLLCIILGHHTISSSISSSGVNHTSNVIVDQPEHQSYHHHEELPHHYTDQWAVHIEGGHEAANQLADKHGFINTGQILPDYYHFVHRKVAKRSIEPCHEYHEALSAEPEVRWHAQQVVKRRNKRDFLHLNSRTPFTPSSTSSASANSNNRNLNGKSKRNQNQITFNDPRWPSMWYLNRGAGLDMNVQEAWAEGITGKGIVVTILDDGLEKDHPDIIQNYDPLASFDVNSLDNDPMPTYDLTDSNRHGTRCAGEVAAEANNSLCAVGIAYEASVGGIRMLDGDVTDAVEARSLSHMPQHIDIFSASWGPDDDGKTVDGPGELATRAFLEGITKGRQGKGSIFVWASGNGGRDHDNCNCDGYTNSIWTLSISSATENGLVPWYSEACSSTLATTYSSGGTGEKQIVTIDLHHSCTSSHTGTSASAPLAAGICALALQANTNLTWRDMQHIVVRTARPVNLIAPDWLTNGVGRNVSHSFGYGLMDAGAMVKLAKRWKTVPEQNKCEVRAPYTDKTIPAKSKVTLDLKVTECPGVNLLEHVQAKVTLTSGRRGDLQIYLVSPQGTRSVLLAHRRHDLNRSGFTDWPFMSVHTWGESPIGKWVLEIHNEGRFADHKNGKLQTWAVVAHGITSNPNDITPDANEPNGRLRGTDQKSQMSGGGMDFDGSENKIILEPSQVQRNQPMSVASLPNISNAGEFPRVSPSRAASLQFPGCLKFSMSMGSPGMCVVCAPALYLQEFKCVSSCSYNFYPEFNPTTGAKICLSCHYSCLTCFGGNESQCLTCHDDSTLRTILRTELSDESGSSKGRRRHETVQTTYKESHCYPTELLSTIDGNDLWYKALLMGVIANVTIVVILVFYIWLQRQRDRSSANINGEFIGDAAGGSDDGDSGNHHDPALGSSWLHLNRKVYSRVAPHDNDLDDEENHAFIAQRSQASVLPTQDISISSVNGSKLNVDFKIAIPPLNTKTFNNNNNNHLNSTRKKIVPTESERLRLAIPLQQIQPNQDLLTPT